MGEDTKNNPVKVDLRSWLVAVLSVGVLLAVANYVYKTVPGSSASGDLPTTFDWRDHQGKSWVTSVKNQGNCGACGAFAPVGAIEAVANIEVNDPDLDLDLSEQYIVSCIDISDDVCGRGLMTEETLGFIKSEGLPDEPCFPYTATNGNCANRCDTWADRLVYIQDYKDIPFDNHYDPSTPPADYNRSAKKHLIQEGPLAVSMQWNGHLLNDSYVCSVLLTPVTSTTPDDSYHGVVMVGYNDIEKYWIMKNQWGDDWPPPNGGGYFKVGYNSNCLFREVYSIEGVYGVPLEPVGQKVRITDDDNWDGDPVIRDHQIVWSKGAGETSSSEKDIYYLSVILPPGYILTPTAITNDDVNQITPTICGSVIYYSERGIIKYYDLLSHMHYQLCSDEMRAQGRCRGGGYGVDCSASAVTFVRYDSASDSEDIVRFDLEGLAFLKERVVNGISNSHLLPPTSKQVSDPNRRPQINVDGLRIVYSEYADDYLLGNSQVYYYDGLPPDPPPFPPLFPDFPKFVAKDGSNEQYNADVWGNVVVWAQEEEGIFGDSDIHIKNLATGIHTVIPRAGNQTMPAIYGEQIAYFDGNDIVLYGMRDQIHHPVTDPQETIAKHISREDLDFQGDIIVWNEMSDDTWQWDLYMFKLS